MKTVLLCLIFLPSAECQTQSSMWSWMAFWSSNESTPPSTEQNNETFIHRMWSWGETAADYWKTGTEIARRSGLTQGCERVTCGAGEILVRNNSAAQVIPDGCGSYGFNLPSQIMIGFTVCCDAHDLCYSKCGAARSQCDLIMRSCHTNVCRVVENLLGNDSSIVSGCYRMVSVLYETVNNLGCLAYHNTQREQCQCVNVRSGR